MAKAQTAAHVTITLDPHVPETLDEVKERIVSIATDYQEAEGKLKLWYDTTVASLITKRDSFEKKADPDAYIARKMAEMKVQLEEEIREKIEAEKHTGAGKATSYEARRDFYVTMAGKFGTKEVTRAEMATALKLDKEKDKGKINGLTAIFKALAEEGFLKWNGKGTINSAYFVIDPKRPYKAADSTPGEQTNLPSG